LTRGDGTGEPDWTAVDRYLADLLVPSDPALAAALATSAAAGLPAHHVSPTQGKLLHLLARAVAARTILEVGTLGGYGAIWLARALPPGGRLVTLELDPRHAEVARTNVVRAGLADVVELRVGPALDSMATLERDGCAPFDLIFLDADKAASADYVTRSLALSRRGTVIVADNVVRGGAVVDAASADPSVQGIRRMHALLATEPRVAATAIQTVGEKGWDGFALAVVVAD
jgi:predicted O-methyltransferase YrrM